MHRITIYPLGNADCSLIDLAAGQKILFDYADMRSEDDPEDLRIRLAEELRKNLKDANREYFDVVAFTHLDNDHICKSSEFFYLEHAEKYQGEGRIKINELWVPQLLSLRRVAPMRTGSSVPRHVTVSARAKESGCFPAPRS